MFRKTLLLFISNDRLLIETSLLREDSLGVNLLYKKHFSFLSFYDKAFHPNKSIYKISTREKSWIQLKLVIFIFLTFWRQSFTKIVVCRHKLCAALSTNRWRSLWLPSTPCHSLPFLPHSLPLYITTCNSLIFPTVSYYNPSVLYHSLPSSTVPYRSLRYPFLFVILMNIDRKIIDNRRSE